MSGGRRKIKPNKWGSGLRPSFAVKASFSGGTRAYSLLKPTFFEKGLKSQATEHNNRYIDM